MAPKRPSPMEEPPSASSSSGEEESENELSGDSEEGEEEGESEEAEPPPPQKQKQPTKVSSPPPKKPQQQQQQQQRKKPQSEPKSESETESGSESESESEQEDDVPIKVIASKPMEEKALHKKVRSEPASKKPEPNAAVKRGGEETEKEKNKDTKRAKKENAEVVLASPAIASPGDVKKTLFQRLWSEDDEIVILKGILEFKEKGVDVTKDMGAFYESVKKSLHCDGTLAQMKDKIFRLRRKFEKSVQRGKLGENKKFGREHDQLAFDLSKKIWGGERGGGVESKVKGNAKKSLDELKAELGIGKERDGEKKGTVKFDQDFVRVVGVEEYVLRRGLDVIGEAKRAAMEEKWRKLQVEELKLFLKRNELVSEQAKLMLAAYKTEEDEDY